MFSSDSKQFREKNSVSLHQSLLISSDYVILICAEHDARGKWAGKKNSPCTINKAIQTFVNTRSILWKRFKLVGFEKIGWRVFKRLPSFIRTAPRISSEKFPVFERSRVSSDSAPKNPLPKTNFRKSRFLLAYVTQGSHTLILVEISDAARLRLRSNNLSIKT